MTSAAANTTGHFKIKLVEIRADSNESCTLACVCGLLVLILYSGVDAVLSKNQWASALSSR